MADKVTILLGRGHHTIFSDEVWYLVVLPDSGEVYLEARWQSDAPERTGYPGWLQTEFCVSRGDGEAVCHVPYGGMSDLLAAQRLSFVPEGIWAGALEECRQRVKASGDQA